MSKDFGVEGIAIVARRAATEELLCGKELLMDFEARLETYGGIVAFGHLAKRLKRHRFQQLRKAIDFKRA